MVGFGYGWVRLSHGGTEGFCYDKQTNPFRQQIVADFYRKRWLGGCAEGCHPVPPPSPRQVGIVAGCCIGTGCQEICSGEGATLPTERRVGNVAKSSPAAPFPAAGRVPHPGR